MRTTLNLPNDVYNMARSLAGAKGISMGEALAELVRRGLRPAVPIDAGKAFPCFVLPEDAEPVTLDKTLEAEDEI